MKAFALNLLPFSFLSWVGLTVIAIVCPVILYIEPNGIVLPVLSLLVGLWIGLLIPRFTQWEVAHTIPNLKQTLSSFVLLATLCVFGLLCLAGLAAGMGMRMILPCAALCLVVIVATAMSKALSNGFP